jgi:transcription termination factor NusB
MPFDVHPRRRSRNHASQVLFGDDSASEMDTELVSDFEDNLDNEKDNQSDTWR